MGIDFSPLENGIEIKNAFDQRRLTNFKLNENKPIHRWYYFKEGFPSDLVKNLIKEFSTSNSNKIIDCFSGVSTTVLTAQELGMISYGVEINPFFKFVGNVKVRNGYDLNLVNQYRNFIFKEVKKISQTDRNKLKIPELTSFRTCFSRKSLYKLLQLKNMILKIEDEKYKRLFLLALASIVEDVSKIQKDGKSLRFSGRRGSNVEKTLNDKLNKIIEDIEWKHKNNINDKLGEVLNGDARKLNFPANKFDLAIFSPPYLNSFDYTEIYKLELWLLDFVTNYKQFEQLSKSTLRSHLSSTFDKENSFENKILTNLIDKISKKNLWNDNIPDMIRSYFNDMKSVFESLHKVLKNNAFCIMVVGNSSYGNIPIPTDLFLGKIAEEVGFSFEELRVLRNLKTSSQQMKDFNNRKFLRESLVILKNNK